MISPEMFLEKLLNKWIEKLQREKEEIVYIAKIFKLNEEKFKSAMASLNSDIAELIMIRDLVSSKTLEMNVKKLGNVI